MPETENGLWYPGDDWQPKWPLFNFLPHFPERPDAATEQDIDRQVADFRRELDDFEGLPPL